jgi:hypothetical protein
MKVTIREYEEDPSSVESSSPSSEATHNHNHENNFQCEYILENKNDNANNSPSKHHHHHHQVVPLQLQVVAKRTNQSSRGGFQNLQKVWASLVLPLGYPHSVDPSYLPYQLYDALQGLCSYWRGVVATRAVLEAAGVGNGNATAASAALQWALRDGTGMIGGLLFSYAASHLFDSHVKEFRLFADVINDVALTLDMLAPNVGPYYSLWILSLSTIGKTMCGMSAGATKGRITQHFARHGNMADLAAKESTQETMVSLLGMMGGVAVAHLLQQLPYAVTWLLFGLLTIVHVWANYQAVVLLKLATLNPERTHVLLKDVIQVLVDDDDDDDDDGDEQIGPNNKLLLLLDQALEAVSTPEDVNESLLSSTTKLLFPTLHVAQPLNPRQLDFVSELAHERYLIGAGDAGGRRHHLSIWLGVGATNQDELQAYVHALLLQAKMAQGETLNSNLVKR